MTAEPAQNDARAADNVTRLSVDGRTILLVGTAHVSRHSVDEVRRVIAETRPDSVCVELDPARYETLADETRWKRLDVREVLARNRTGLFLAALLFAGFQKRLGDRLGVRPGAEMLAAVEEGERVGAKIVLADRDVQSTLARCHASLGRLDRLKIALLLAVLPFAAADIDEKQVEELKTREAMADAMDAFAKHMPALKTPLVDERDRYLAASLAAAEGSTIVAVIGAAHAAGVAKYVGQPIDRDALVVVPPPTRLERTLPWIWTLGIAVSLGLSGIRHGFETGISHAVATISVATSFGLLLATMAVGAHIVVSLCAALIGPFSLLVPTVRFGKMLGRLQARLTPPLPEDAMQLRTDVLKPSKARTNSFLKPVLIAVMSPAARAVGAAIGISWAIVQTMR